jgi:Zn finger protein HypA/HybF involved in hydrogenase expression
MSTHLDGNMLGGELGELFTVDITAATGKCASCGTVSAIAQTRVYADAPGVVARCPSCGGVMLRVARSPGRAWLDLRGIACLQLAVPAQP